MIFLQCGSRKLLCGTIIISSFTATADGSSLRIYFHSFCLLHSISMSQEKLWFYQHTLLSQGTQQECSENCRINMKSFSPKNLPFVCSRQKLRAVIFLHLALPLFPFTIHNYQLQTYKICDAQKLFQYPIWKSRNWEVEYWENVSGSTS